MAEQISQERRENLKSAIKRLEAYQEIQNNMGRCMAAFNFRQADKVLDYFALGQEDVSLEYADEGVFKGINAVETIIKEVVGAEPKSGEMLDLQLTTPMIEVAEDIKTAKALWWCPGAGAIPEEDKDPKAIWCWGMIAADFIFENNNWKIWHMHYFRFIKCDYDKGWVKDTSMLNRLNTPVHPLSSPSTYHNPYSPLSVREGIPACPRPYKTWTDSSWMTEKDKSR
ncbi:SnoaL-like protein [Ruminiclostridium sufflavum DSM 19573]|uniref:SnoaL-like protein n=1 Tax=Ruminiclostridium sufflavum DSM 19573 TaxID=1121337 RepID=A0A318Y3W9_9FIRM|nr:nuclear transport factor 2 family protein [Ruminiclostridium sufflavum]PYG90278.1 SnoaL-like protein [Ruminiclostridium sufflavum DSM 19573]